jgi:hypothetical protein
MINETITNPVPVPAIRRAASFSIALIGTTGVATCQIVAAPKYAAQGTRVFTLGSALGHSTASTRQTLIPTSDVVVMDDAPGIRTWSPPA